MSRVETLLVHAGWSCDAQTGAVNVPIYLSSTFVQQSPGQHLGYDYSRAQNPTREVFEKAMTILERGSFAVATNSGCSAQLLLSQLLQSGDHVLVSDDVYGGTWRQWERVLKPNMNLKVDFVDFRSQRWIEHLKPETKMIWVETPSNPLLKLVDIGQIAKVIQGRGIHLVVDNTFATPYLQNPLDHGADWVVHSTTKYISGHSDLLGGVVVGKQADWEPKMRFLATSLGVTMSVMDAYWHWRSLKTLAVRLNAAEQNAQKIATFLSQHPLVETVYYPGLLGHPDFLLMQKQMRGPGAMVTFRLRLGLNHVLKFFSALRVFKLAESLGAVESLANHPATMTHASVPPERRASLGVDERLIRLSIGIEHIEDLLADLEQALDQAR